MLDPLTSLAFSMFSGKGVYALLLGSGISKAAEIPTGWEVTLDLIKKIAAAQEEECGDNPAGWYREKFGTEPDYSDLLALVAQNPAERTNALASYFEATDEEKERGAKTPTAAHQAIARLVSRGYVRVIITTNFDRLLEQALATEGVATTVISTDDMVSGALPLVHAACTVIKVHGDYRDTRFRNTVEELASYSSQMNGLLDRVIDEYGMVVVGWSATWDTALRSAFLRAPNRRFAMTWAARGDLTAAAQELATFRGALVEQVDSADQFFSALLAKIESLEKFNSPHPMSVSLAVVTLKRYLSESRYRIDLHDLLLGEAERTLAALAKSPVAMKMTIAQHPEYLEMIAAYEAASEIVVALIGVFAYFSESDRDNLLGKVVVRLLDLPEAFSNYSQVNDLRSYPACLAFYAAGVAACASGRYTILTPLFRSTRAPSDENVYENTPLHMTVYAMKALSGLHRAGGQPNPHSASQQVFLTTRELLRQLVPNDDGFADAFDRFEYLLALRIREEKLASKIQSQWAPVGRFLTRKRDFGKHISLVLRDEAERTDVQAGFLSSGMFPSRDAYLSLDDGFQEWWKQIPHY